MFPKARVKRFNEELSCAPPPGYYEPIDLKKKGPSHKFEKGDRFQHQDDNTLSSTSSMSLPGLTSTPYVSKKMADHKSDLSKIQKSLKPTIKRNAKNYLDLICSAIEQVESNVKGSNVSANSQIFKLDETIYNKKNIDENEVGALLNAISNLTSLHELDLGQYNELCEKLSKLEARQQESEALAAKHCLKMTNLLAVTQSYTESLNADLFKTVCENQSLKETLTQWELKFSALKEDYSVLSDIVKSTRELWENEIHDCDLVVQDLQTKITVASDEKIVLVNTLEVEKMRMQKIFNSMKDEMQVLRTEYIVSAETVKHLNECLTNVERESSELESKVNEYKEQIEVLENDVQVLNHKLTSHSTELHNFEAKYEDLVQRKTELDQQHSKLSLTVESLKHENTKLLYKTNEWEMLAVTERNYREELTEKNKNNSKLIDSLSKELNQMKTKEKCLENELHEEKMHKAEAVHRIGSLQAIVKCKDEQNNILQSDLKCLSLQHENLFKKINVMEADKAKTDEHRLQLKIDNDNKENELITLKSKVCEQLEEIKLLQSKLQDLNESYCSLSDDAKLDKLKISELLESIETSNKYYDLYSEIQMQKLLLEDKVEAIGIELKDALESKLRSEEKIDCLENIIQDLHLDIEQLQQENIINTRCMEQNDDKLADLEMQLDFIKRANTKLNNEVKIFTDKIQILAEEKESLEKLVEKQKSCEESKYKKTLEEYSTKLRHMELQVGSMQSDLLLQGNETRLWKEKYESLQAMVEPFQAQLDSYEKEKDFLLSQQSATQAEMKDLLTKYSELLGHQNQKQKIKYVQKLKEENLILRQENTKLKEANLRFTSHRKDLSKTDQKVSKENALRTPGFTNPNILTPRNY